MRHLLLFLTTIRLCFNLRQSTAFDPEARRADVPKQLGTLRGFNP